MNELAIELRAVGRAINHEEYIDAGVVPLTLAHAADRIEQLEAALRVVIENNDHGSYESTGQAINDARATLDQSSPPKAIEREDYPKDGFINDYD